ncbi:MAG: diguanylate cyclase [Aquincola tertiaricarbonis]|uniref:sensor domain-containing diguanylate cyclase n=1 Tax=Aquincola tertiaricarbonis TaxID=391953 RepID=UPI001E3F72DE|nr:sensor domain-containing diguanylate cyclase [Aquincola tertiaricarbonis]
MALLLLGSMGSLSWMVGASMSRQLAAEQGRALHNLGRGIASLMGQGLDERLDEIARLAEGDLYPYAAGPRTIDDRSLDRIAANRAHYSWIGMARTDGQVLAATRHMLVGQSVAERPWFRHGLQAPYTGDVHKAKLLAAMLPPAADGAPPRFIDFAAPLTDGNGRVVAVIGAHVNWDWGREIIALLRSNDARQHGVRVYIVDATGNAILLPLDAPSDDTVPQLDRAAHAPALLEWPDGTDYLTAVTPVEANAGPNRLGWKVVVRQPASEALRPAYAAQRVVWWSGLGLSLLAAVLAWWMAGNLSRPLTALHAAARRIGAGETDVQLPAPSGASEVRSLNAALTTMMATLATRERSLRTANETLEARVAERTQALADANAELTLLARRDALTGLPNRRAADERLQSEVARHRRSQLPLALLVLDIDHFKRVNDQHGHAVGDTVLAEVAQVLQRTLRTTDFVARTGGEEFIVLLPDTDAAGGLLAAEKLRAAVQAHPIAAVGTVTVSVGLATRAEAFRDAAAATHAADVALYSAKRSGRNRVVRFDEAAQISDSLLDALGT